MLTPLVNCPERPYTSLISKNQEFTYSHSPHEELDQQILEWVLGLEIITGREKPLHSQLGSSRN